MEGHNQRPTASLEASPPPSSEQTPLLRGTTANTVVAPHGNTGARSRPPRIVGMDLFRGLLMAVMAIDHARYPFSKLQYPHETWNEMPDYRGNRHHFLVRFITQFCAPGFFMLMGWGVVLFSEARLEIGWSWGQILKHFAIRGSLLCLINVLMVGSMMGNFKVFITMVLFALGVNLFLSAVVLYVVAKLVPNTTVALEKTFKMATPSAFNAANRVTDLLFAIAFALFACLASEYVPSPDYDQSRFSLWWKLWFMPAGEWGKDEFMSAYPPIPWLAPTLLGLALGRISKRSKLDASRQALLCVAIGAVLIAVFVPVRFASGFGNINPELLNPPIRSSVISFFNLVKYPPSLVYLCLTLGVDLVLLGPLLLVPASRVDAARGVLMVFGNSSLFFFVTHSVLFSAGGMLGRAVGVVPEDGFGDLGFWSIYAAGMAFEYVMCRKYAEFKRGTGPDSVWRFF
ncbi:hypothetical protein DFJ73DRAFT_848534 [Zopfochytrium polystomum]|nr:hypothetical protein DFJ73DRAFT_848534 [Zopfochytrium polystomum]